MHAPRTVHNRPFPLQEYGEDAPAPNKNTVYLSYLDSVRYFQPEGKDAGGAQALRTHVYHEVLLAYMDQAIKLGMNAMYIWSCPPVAVRARSTLRAPQSW